MNGSHSWRFLNRRSGGSGMIDPNALIAVAKQLLQSSHSQSGLHAEAMLRRAVSTAYYAIFHAALRFATDELVGENFVQTARYKLIYRSFNHKHMKDACDDVRRGNKKSKEALGKANSDVAIRTFCEAFIILQERRHLADYDPVDAPHFSDAKDLVSLAELSIQELQVAGSEDRRNFLAYLMVSVRS